MDWLLGGDSKVTAKKSYITHYIEGTINTSIKIYKNTFSQKGSIANQKKKKSQTQLAAPGLQTLTILCIRISENAAAFTPEVILPGTCVSTRQSKDTLL